MNKTMRKAVTAARVHEAKMQVLAWGGKPEHRKERIRQIENRHWGNRKPIGAFSSGLKDHEKLPGVCIIITRN